MSICKQAEKILNQDQPEDYEYRVVFGGRNTGWVAMQTAISLGEILIAYTAEDARRGVFHKTGWDTGDAGHRLRDAIKMARI